MISLKCKYILNDIFLDILLLCLVLVVKILIVYKNVEVSG